MKRSSRRSRENISVCERWNAVQSVFVNGAALSRRDNVSHECCHWRLMIFINRWHGIRTIDRSSEDRKSRGGGGGMGNNPMDRNDNNSPVSSHSFPSFSPLLCCCCFPALFFLFFLLPPESSRSSARRGRAP